MEVHQKNKLIKLLEAKSDDILYKEAEKFLDEFSTLTNSQMSNLENIFNSSWSPEHEEKDTIKFIDRQKSKAIKQVRDQEAKFWEGLKEKIKKLPKRLIWELNISDDYAKTARYFILKEFLQHLIAEHLFRRQGGV